MNGSNKAIEGTMTGGPKVGCRVRAEDDLQGSGGFLIIYWDPNRPNDGWDNWVETFDDITGFLKFRGWIVEWDTPIEALRR